MGCKSGIDEELFEKNFVLRKHKRNKLKDETSEGRGGLIPRRGEAGGEAALASKVKVL